MTVRALLSAAAVVFVLAGCASPEARRVRAEGPGADVGNRGRVVRMHEGSLPYWRTPRLLAHGGPIEPARQADRLSRER